MKKISKILACIMGVLSTCSIFAACAENGSKEPLLAPDYSESTKEFIKVCFSDTPRNATQSDLKVVLPEEYKEPIRVEYGDTIKGGLPKGEPLNKDDYKFDKWVTYIDGKEVTITDATVFGKSDFSGIQGGEIIIYPVLKNLWVGPF